MPLGRRLWRAARSVAVVSLLLGIVAGCAFVIYATRLAREVPDAWELARATSAQPSVVLAANGERLTQFEPAFREWVPLDSIPTHLVDALLATEDRRFYEHGGIDVRRTAAALWNTARGRREGGSTITQQLARNLFPDEIGNAGTVERKLKEAVAAYRIERDHTKRTILEAYLNTVPFLYNAHGVELAARTYFGTSAPALTLPQSAVLVAMLKGPSEYNPVRAPERARARRDLVLRRMVAVGALPAAEADRIAADSLGVTLAPQPGTYSRAPYFTAAVRRVVDRWAEAHGYDVERDGLVIRTTLDLDLQAAAEAAVADRVDRLQRTADREWRRGPPRAALDAALARTDAYGRARDAGQDAEAALAAVREDAALVDSVRAVVLRAEAALVALDPSSGAVRAYVGGRDWALDEFDHAGVARRQPGSTFKAFVYAAALQRGYAPGDEVSGGQFSVQTDNGTWAPAGGRSEGTLADALAYSKNNAAARLTQEVGPHRVALVAQRMGVTSTLDVVPSIGLGTSETTLLEMVGAYGTIANDGLHRRPTLVSRIETAEGRVLEVASPSGFQSLTRRDARTLFDMMRGVVDRGTGRDLRALGATGDLAGKTGTTQNHADGWFIGMRPGLVAGAWVGFNDRRVHYRSMQTGSGSKTALPIVAAFLRRVQDRLPDGLTLPRPPGYGEALLAEESQAPDTLDVDALLQDAAVADPARDLYDDGGFDAPVPEAEPAPAETPNLRPLPTEEREAEPPAGRIGW